MINRNASVRNSEKSFELPPIHGALPPAEIVRKPGNVSRKRVTGPRKRQNAYRTPQISASDRQAFDMPSLKPVGERRYRDRTTRAARYAAVHTERLSRPALSQKEFDMVFPKGTYEPVDVLRPYAVLPPIGSRAKEPSTPKYNTSPPLEPKPPTSQNKRGKEKLANAEEKRATSGQAKQTLAMSEPREASPTLLLFYKAQRKHRRDAVCLENEPDLTDIEVRLKEIFLRRNMEEMYLI